MVQLGCLLAYHLTDNCFLPQLVSAPHSLYHKKIQCLAFLRCSSHSRWCLTFDFDCDLHDWELTQIQLLVPGLTTASETWTFLPSFITLSFPEPAPSALPCPRTQSVHMDSEGIQSHSLAFLRCWSSDGLRHLCYFFCMALLRISNNLQLGFGCTLNFLRNVFLM